MFFRLSPPVRVRLIGLSRMLPLCDLANLLQFEWGSWNRVCFYSLVSLKNFLCRHCQLILIIELLVTYGKGLVFLRLRYRLYNLPAAKLKVR